MSINPAPCDFLTLGIGSPAMPLLTQDFDYDLPNELIASHPLADRAASRMLVVHREKGIIQHRMFRDLPDYVQGDDLLVLNNTKVIPARLLSDDGKKELLCLNQISALEWRCLVKPGKALRVGKSITVAGITGTVTEVFENGDRLIRWDSIIDLNLHGHLALPHYMGREDEALDRERYQTIYAREEGAIAAPTAGLHFTSEMLEKFTHTFLTLHVGVGTFRPVSVDIVDDHIMHSERYAVSANTARCVNEASRVIAVGTTVTRVLETLGRPLLEQRGETDIFIRPPYQFRAIDGLLTNFHLPQSTLIMLVSAFAGQELIMEAYRRAVAERYRFFSYGDCMLLL